MKSIVRFLRETHGQTIGTTVKVLLNKFLYLFSIAAGRAAPAGRLHSSWYWTRHPFSLRREVLWSTYLKCWFRPEDESAIECMLHMSQYEPVSWVTPQPGEVFLDVGGYVGWYSILAARAVTTAGNVIALEPDSVNRMQLDHNLKLNGIDNVVVMPLAAWSGSGRIGWCHAEQPVWHRISDADGSVTQETISIDDLASKLNLTRLDWIKFDIEGAEVQALQGAAQTLSRFRPKLFIEIHETKQVVEDILRSHGYIVECEQYDQAPERHGWILARNPK